jgi:hypothetical protein
VLITAVTVRFELRASGLQSRHSTASVISLVHFVLIILEGGRVSQTISPTWPENVILLISAFQVSRITGNLELQAIITSYPVIRWIF